MDDLLQVFKDIQKSKFLGTHHLVYFDRFTSNSEFEHKLYFGSLTSNNVLRPFLKSRFLIGREVQVEIKFCRKGRTKI